MGSAQTVATSAVARNFAKGNLNAALQWAEGLSGPVQLAATREIVNLWSNSDPEATGAWIMQQGSQQVRSEALRQLAGNWVSRDPGAAIDYAQTIADVGLRNGFVQSAMQRFSSMDPVAAANWLSSDAAKPHASSLVGSVSSRWAAFDPGSAAGWASSITDSALRNKALSAVSTSWSQTNPTEAAQWAWLNQGCAGEGCRHCGFQRGISQGESRHGRSMGLAHFRSVQTQQFAEPDRERLEKNRSKRRALICAFFDSHAGGFKAKAAAINRAWLDRPSEIYFEAVAAFFRVAGFFAAGAFFSRGSNSKVTLPSSSLR
jgi:hypothetical protein